MSKTKLVGGLPRLTVDGEGLEISSVVLDFIRQKNSQKICPSRHEIAFELSLAPTVVDKAIAELQAAGAIEREENWNCVQ